MIHRTGLTYDIREGTVDELVIKEIWDADEYRLNDTSKFTQNGCIIDIGANIGAFSTRAAIIFRAQVHAYEPEPHNFELLQANAKHANDEYAVNIECLPWAVSNNHEGLWLEDRQGNSGSYKEDTEGTTWVKSVTLDDVLSSHGHCFYLKMDIEGGEVDAIEGVDPKLLGDVDYIAMEYHGQTPGWGDMVRKLSGFFDLDVVGHGFPNQNSGGMIYGVKKA